MTFVPSQGAPVRLILNDEVIACGTAPADVCSQEGVVGACTAVPTAATRDAAADVPTATVTAYLLDRACQMQLTAMAAANGLAVVSQPAAASALLNPLRRAILQTLAAPGSAIRSGFSARSS